MFNIFKRFMKEEPNPVVMKEISEPTYLLAEAIDKGDVRVYTKRLSHSRRGLCEFKIILVLPNNNKLIEGIHIDMSYNIYTPGIKNKLYLTPFNEDECEYLLPFIEEAIERRIKEKATKELAEKQTKDTVIRKQITEDLIKQCSKEQNDLVQNGIKSTLKGFVIFC